MNKFRRAVLAASLPMCLAGALGAVGQRSLLVLGDSLTAGYGLDESQAWPALLQERLDRELPGWRVVNAGVSGDTSADGLARLDWLLKSPPTAAFICLGANDGLRGMPTRDIERNLKAILARLGRSGAALYLAGMDLPTNLGSAYRAEFRALLRRVSKAGHADFMPFLLKDVAGVPALNQADGVHPTAEGQRLVARNVGDFLLPRLKALQDRPAARGQGVRVLRRREDVGVFSGGNP